MLIFYSEKKTQISLNSFSPAVGSIYGFLLWIEYKNMLTFDRWRLLLNCDLNNLYGGSNWSVKFITIYWE